MTISVVDFKISPQQQEQGKKNRWTKYAESKLHDHGLVVSLTVILHSLHISNILTFVHFCHCHLKQSQNYVMKLFHCSKWCRHRFKQPWNDITTRFKQYHLPDEPATTCNTTHSQRRVKQLCLCIASHSKGLLTRQQFRCLSLHIARKFDRVVLGYFDPIWNFDSALF